MGAQRPLLEAGETWREPKGMGGFNHYGLFTNVTSGPAGQDFHIDFTYKDAPGVGTRIHMLRDGGTRVFLAETPALRKAGHYKDQLVYKWRMPHLIARRRGGEGSGKSVGVEEPRAWVGRQALGHTATLLALFPLLARDDGMVALRIALADRTDTLLYSLGQPRAMSAGGLEAHGKLALVAESDGKADGYLVAGTRLRKATVRLSAERAAYRGVVTGAVRTLDGGAADAFITTADLPAGRTLHGKWLVVTHGKVRARYGRPVRANDQGVGGPYGTITHAYEIDRVEKKNGETWICLTHDHGLRMAAKGATEVFSMWRTYEGQETFVVHTHAATVATPAIEPTSGPRDRLKMGQFVPFMDMAKVSLDAGGKPIRYTTDGRAPTPGSPLYKGPFVLRESATVKAVVPNVGGVQPPRVASRFFQRALAPAAVQDVRPGLVCTPVSSGKAGEPAVAGNFAGEPAGGGKSPQKRFEGLIRVPRDGIYTFYVRSSGGAVLTVGGIALIDTTGLGRFREWRARIALEAGLHPIGLHLTYGRGRGGQELTVRYAGPGIAKQALPDSALFHTQHEGREHFENRSKNDARSTRTSLGSSSSSFRRCRFNARIVTCRWPGNGTIGPQDARVLPAGPHATMHSASPRQRGE